MAINVCRRKTIKIQSHINICRRETIKIQSHINICRRKTIKIQSHINVCRRETIKIQSHINVCRRKTIKIQSHTEEKHLKSTSLNFIFFLVRYNVNCNTKLTVHFITPSKLHEFYVYLLCVFSFLKELI